MGPAMEAMVMTMPSTAATMPKPGIASPVFSNTVTGLEVLVFHGVELQLHEHLQLVGFDFAINNGAQPAAEKFDGVLVGRSGGIF